MAWRTPRCGGRGGGSFRSSSRSASRRRSASRMCARRRPGACSRSIRRRRGDAPLGYPLRLEPRSHRDPGGVCARVGPRVRCRRRARVELHCFAYHERHARHAHGRASDRRLVGATACTAKRRKLEADTCDVSAPMEAARPAVDVLRELESERQRHMAALSQLRERLLEPSKSQPAHLHLSLPIAHYQGWSRPALPGSQTAAAPESADSGEH